tara:strand:- start:241 stop:645 length:405 start_codon:yes stop_codon:yes gene_type:complete
MHKINLNYKKTLEFLLSSLAIILIIFSIKINIAYGINNNWTEVSKSIEGFQYIESDSLINKGKGVVEITTKYLKAGSRTSGLSEEYIYRMEINCLTNKFKDISVNGKDNLNAKWEDTNEDKLINDVITESCKNV